MPPEVPGLDLLADENVDEAALRIHSDELPGAFSVISPGLVRVRPRP